MSCPVATRRGAAEIDPVDRGVQAVSVEEGCFQNIGARGRRRRLRGFVICVAVTLVLWGLLAGRHASVPSYLVLVPFAALAALYYFQAREMTCVVLAATGKREADAAATSRPAGEWLVAIRRQARKVWFETLLATLLATSAAIGLGLLFR